MNKTSKINLFIYTIVKVKGLSQNKKIVPQKGRDELVLSSSLLCTIKV